MSYNKKQGMFEKKIWMKEGTQFKFRVNGSSQVSAGYPQVTVILYISIRILKDSSITFLFSEENITSLFTMKR
jgi:hypothetical protein